MRRSKGEGNYIINAIATYICVQAKRKNQFTREVDTAPIAEMLGATYSEQETAHLKAREILRTFVSSGR